MTVFVSFTLKYVVAYMTKMNMRKKYEVKVNKFGIVRIAEGSRFVSACSFILKMVVYDILMDVVQLNNV
jgi:hypothetical protein